MGDDIPFFVYWGWRIWMKSVHFFFYIPMLIFSCQYWGKGKTVPPIKNSLLLKSATELAAEIRSGKLKSEDVILAYIERITEVEPYINAVVEHRFEDAIKQAKEADAVIADGKVSKKWLEVEKPLFGVPFTVKLLLKVKGLKWSGGTALFKDQVADEDASTVALLKKAGGIFLALTNCPPFGLAPETHNPLYGITSNPYDTNRTPGGSSGGESALLAAAGSVIGLANDFGGSIRTPAHFTGIFGHKPSIGLVSNDGSFPILNPKPKTLLYSGPMCRYPEDLVTVMKILTSENKEKVQLNKPVNFKNLKVYYQTSNMDPRTEPVDEEIKNAIKKAASYFRENYGAVATEKKIKLFNFSSYISYNISIDDMPDFVGELTSGKCRKWNFFTGLMEFLKFCVGKSDYSFTTINYFTYPKLPIFYSPKRIPQSRQQLQKLKEELNTLLDENSVLFYPTSPTSARRHFESINLILNSIYTCIFNFLGLPVTQCPLGLNKAGLPQGMQIVGGMNNDSLTMACAAELSKAFGGWIPPS